MAGKGTTKTTARRPRKRTQHVPRSRRRLRLAWVAGVLFASVYLYYQPLTSYFDTRAELSAQRGEVLDLRVTKADLEQRLSVATSNDAMLREARRIGYVRPGERLFIVKGIPDWRRARRTLGKDG